MCRWLANMTPIKIPGRRSRGTTRADAAARKSLSRPPGRPLKIEPSEETPRLSTSSSVISLKKVKTRSMRNIKPKREMSLLEKLPTELLENVFFYGMNLDLARASPIIGGKLSSKSIYIRIILEAFSPTWEEYCLGREPFDYEKTSTAGDPKLQSAVLRCRWASLPLLLNTQEIYLQRSGFASTVSPISWFKSSGREITSVIERFEIDFLGFQEFIKGPIFINVHLQSTDIAKGVEIPHSLLLGPWSEITVRHLFWVVKSGAQLDWLASTSGEVALVGVRNAILAGDGRVIYLLEWAGLRGKLDGELLIWALRHVGGDKVSVMNLLFDKIHLSSAWRHKFQHELARLRREAKQSSDQERLEFYDLVEDISRL